MSKKILAPLPPASPTAQSLAIENDGTIVKGAAINPLSAIDKIMTDYNFEVLVDFEGNVLTEE